MKGTCNTYVQYTAQKKLLTKPHKAMINYFFLR